MAILDRAKAKDYFDKLDVEKVNAKRQTMLDNMMKKVKFYQSGKSDKYKVPSELQPLVDINDERTLRERILSQINIEIEKEQRKLEQ